MIIIWKKANILPPEHEKLNIATNEQQITKRVNEVFTIVIIVVQYYNKNILEQDKQVSKYI